MEAVHALREGMIGFRALEKVRWFSIWCFHTGGMTPIELNIYREQLGLLQRLTLYLSLHAAPRAAGCRSRVPALPALC